jgi:hypothetical protein
VLSISDTAIESVLPYFADGGIDVAFLVPTSTGMTKSIMDATMPVRQFLSRNSIHDYDEQEQGQESKVAFPTFFVNADSLTETSASLYRPITKKGDPRIWFGGLKQYCTVRNLLGIVTNGEALYVLNLSDADIIGSICNGGTAAKILELVSSRDNETAMELLSKLKSIHRLGFVDTIVRGDTGIGMTLEKLLEIPPNSAKTPDYKGIEIKSSRHKAGSKNRVNLFTQVPNWRKSKMKTAQELLDAYGYVRNGRKQLYCTVTAEKPNPQGLVFVVDEYLDILFNRSKDPDTNSIQDAVLWEIESLRRQLRVKHRETFWITAESKVENGIEKFRYDSVTHTRKPNDHLFGILLDQSIITMDYTLSQYPTRVRDHGYIFKIKPDNVGLLFPEPIWYSLGDE